MELIPEEIDRISPELSIGFERFPALQRVGIKRWVNGGITFTPDGNPLVGPVPGRRNFWSACGVMAGFSQGAGIGLALANWIADGDPGDDVFGMDITRFGPFATDDDVPARTPPRSSMHDAFSSRTRTRSSRRGAPQDVTRLPGSG